MDTYGKLKKNQTLKIQYKVLSGITWNEGATPKTVIMDNNIGNAWEDDCYNLAHAVAFDTAEGAVQTVSVTNTTGATVTYEGSSCICIGIQNKGLATVAATVRLSPVAVRTVISTGLPSASINFNLPSSMASLPALVPSSHL